MSQFVHNHEKIVTLISGRSIIVCNEIQEVKNIIPFHTIAQDPDTANKQEEGKSQPWDQMST